MNQLNEKLFTLLLDVLELIVKFRSVTELQLLRLFNQYSWQEVYKVLGWAGERELIAPMFVDLPAVTDTDIRYGRTKTRAVEIFYVKEAGKALLLEHRPDSWCVRKLHPTKTHLLRMYHNLLVVEALIFIIARAYRVAGFWVEDELRAAGENLADLRVQVYLDDETWQYLDAEIVVQNKRRQLNENKAFGMIYFVPTRTKLALVQDTKPHDEVVHIHLDGVPEPRPAVTRPANLSRSKERLCRALAEHGCILTAGAVAALVGRRRQKVSAALSKLARAGHLDRSTVQMAPGLQRGCPHVLYALDTCFSALHVDREFAARYSQFIEFWTPRGFQISDVDQTRDQAVISRDGGSLILKVLDREDLEARWGKTEDLEAWWEGFLTVFEERRFQAEEQNR